MADPAEIEEVVAAVPLFARLSPRQRARLAAKATTRSYPAGSIVVRQGDTSMSFYVVLGGHVRIDHEAEGDSVQVDEARRGGFFGELGLIGDQPRAATVTAVEDTECALLAKWDFQNELREDPEIAIALLPVLSQRLLELDAQLARASSSR